MKKYFSSILVIFIFLALIKLGLTAGDAPDDVLQPGQCRCDDPEHFTTQTAAPNASKASDFLRGICQYQARAEGGTETFNSLLRIAQLFIRDNPVNSSSIQLDNNRPVQGNGYNMIVWWFEGKEDDNTPFHHPANEALCNFLKSHDRLYPAPKRTLINIKAFLYSFERGYNREFGLDVTSFFGHKSGDPKDKDNRNDLTTSLDKGIFSTASGIGNPLASILNLGIHAAIEKKHAKEISTIEWSCFVGESCNKGRTQTSHYAGVTQTIDEQLGIKLSATPRIFSDDDTLIELYNLEFFYAIPTTTKEAPVLKFAPYNNETLRLRTNELFVLGSYTIDRDVSTGELIGTGDDKAHTQTLMLIQASRQDQNTEQPAYSGVPLLSLDRTFTPEELEQLPNGKLDLKDILKSIERVCYADPVNPDNQEPICGFRFNQMDQKFINYRMKFELEGPISGMSAPIAYWKLGEVWNSKGYYQLPLFEHDEPAQEYTLTIQIDDKGPSDNDRKQQDLVGMKFTFTHYKNSSDPIYFQPRGIQWLKRGFFTKLFGG